MIHALATQAISALTGLVLPAASANARATDGLLFALIGGTIAVLLLVFGLMLAFSIRYRHGSRVSRGGEAERSFKFEIAWTSATLLVFFGLFLWGAELYVQLLQPKPGALRIAVTGKQWMWKAEHPGGQSEINALHLPLGRAVELLMTSEDVIHDFSVPAFRLKRDVLPGRYTSMSFTPTEPGTFRLFCTQLCGTDHSVMGGEVVVMRGPEFESWLAANPAAAGLVPDGRALFTSLGCSGCHQTDTQRRGTGGPGRGPNLAGVYGRPVPLADGTVAIADDQYVRDSILTPARQVVAGYASQMPSYKGVVSEADLLRLLAYIKSLAGMS